MARFDRRQFLQACAAITTGGLVPRTTWGAAAPNQPLWINIQASGGWDQTLFCDPKPALRPQLATKNFQIYGVNYVDKNGKSQSSPTVGGAAALEVKATPGGGIPYLALADFHADQTTSASYKALFPHYYDRITVFNGIDTGTNNHSVGERYCASGSTNESFPCMAAQLAGVLGGNLPLGFMTMGGRDETADMVSSTPMTVATMRSLLMLTNPNDINGDNAGSDYFYAPNQLNTLRQFRAARLARQQAAASLPDAQQGLAAMHTAQQSQAVFGNLKYSTGYYDEQAMVRIAFDAWRNGLATSLNVPKGGFDAHGDAEAEASVGGVYGGNSSLFALFEFLKFIIDESENPSGGKTPIPVVVVISSDFGRTPYYSGNGSDHWPIASMMIVQNNLAKALGFALPTNTVIGATTDGDASLALRPIKIDPTTFKPSSNGIVLTPGHIHRVIRRMGGIEGHPKLSPFPLTVDKDLNLG